MEEKILMGMIKKTKPPISNLKKIKVLAMDVDGILTNGEIIVQGDGKETKIYNVQDGFGIVVFQKFGYKTAIITARSATAVAARAQDLKIHKVYQDAFPKTTAYEDMLKEFGVRDEEVCYMGDDLPDLPVLNRVGLAVTVPNAVEEAKKAADYVTRNPGGQGAVREVIELIMKAQGTWKKALATFEKP